VIVFSSRKKKNYCVILFSLKRRKKHRELYTYRADKILLLIHIPSETAYIVNTSSERSQGVSYPIARRIYYTKTDLRKYFPHFK